MKSIQYSEFLMGQVVKIIVFFVIVVGVFFLGSSPLFGQNGWIWQNPLPQGNWLTSVQALDASTVIAVGAGGTIIKSTDGGQTWKKDHTIESISEQLTSVSFADQHTGWIVGGNGTVLKTSDGGTTWNTQSNVPVQWNLNYVVATSFGTVVIAGDSGTILKTNNNGSSWLIAHTGTKQNLQSISFANSNIAYAVGDGGTILKSIDGGANWSSLDAHLLGVQNLYSVHFVAPDTGWVVGTFRDSTGRRNMIATFDGGQTWIPQLTHTDFVLYTLTFVGRNKIFAVDDHALIVSTNGGRVWQSLVRIDSVNTFRGMSFAPTDTSVGWLVGSSGEIRKSTDGGASWFRITVGEQSDFHSIQAIDAEHLVAVGDWGQILLTNNGGSTWNTVASVTNRSLRSLQFFSTNAGCAVGDGGIILRTVDAGLNWDVVPNDTISLTSINFIDGLNGWAVGFNGAAYQTTDAGSHWHIRQITNVDSSYTLSSVHFVDQQNGWVVANSSKSKILSTTNGGLSWQTSHTDSTGAQLLSLYFLNQHVGWAVGKYRSVLKTTDGGQHWVAHFTGPGASLYLYSIRFADENNGWIAGAAGTILRSTDGGLTWFLQSSTTRNDLQCIAIVNSVTAWAVGSSGTILNTIDGGGVGPPPVRPPSVQVGVYPSFPNPFVASLKKTVFFRFRTNTAGIVTIQIYDILGKFIRELNPGYLDKGLYDQHNGFTPTWDGLDLNGLAVPSGVYFFTVSTPDFKETGKMVLLR